MQGFRKNNLKLIHRRERLKAFKRYKYMYLLLIIPIIHQLVFSYAPMYGVVIAFKDFRIARGILGSEWVGLKHFVKVFNDYLFIRSFRNTLVLSLLSIITTFPITILFAILLNELRNMRFKRIVQTISYLPHFLSWVIVSSFVYQILSPQVGVLNFILVRLGIISEPANFIILKSWFKPIYIISGLWKGVGWGAIIYLAAIAGIETSQYEAADIEGANRFHKAAYITLPSIMPTVTILLTLRIGQILNVGFDQIFNLYNTSTYEVADVISTYVYRKGLIEAKYDYSTAIGMFQNLVGFILIMLTNYFAKKTNGYSLL